MSKNPANPVLSVVDAVSQGDRVRTLSTGVRARLRPVAASLIDEVQMMIKDPEIPMWRNEAKDRDEPNPNDPGYLREVEEVNRKRAMASVDAMIVFGVELDGGLPADEEWLPKLRLFARRTGLDLSGYDLSDPLEKEFVYKKFIAVSTKDLQALAGLSSITEEAVEQAAKSFPGN